MIRLTGNKISQWGLVTVSLVSLVSDILGPDPVWFFLLFVFVWGHIYCVTPDSELRNSGWLRNPCGRRDPTWVNSIQGKKPIHWAIAQTSWTRPYLQYVLNKYSFNKKSFTRVFFSNSNSGHQYLRTGSLIQQASTRKWNQALLKGEDFIL